MKIQTFLGKGLFKYKIYFFGNQWEHLNCGTYLLFKLFDSKNAGKNMNVSMVLAIQCTQQLHKTDLQ